MSDNEKTYYYVEKFDSWHEGQLIEKKRIYKDKGMYTFEGIESALSKNGGWFYSSSAIYQLIENEAGKQYIAPRKRYDSTIIDDSGKRVIYDKEKLTFLLAESFAQQMVRYEDIKRFLKHRKGKEAEYKKFVLKHLRFGVRILKVLFPKSQAPILNEAIDEDV